MELQTAKILAIALSILVALSVMLFLLVYKYFRTEQKSAKLEQRAKKTTRNRPKPLKLGEVRYHRVASQCTPLVITPTTPSQFTIPPSRQHQDDGVSSPPDHSNAWFSPKLGKAPALLHHSPRLLRTMSEGHSPTTLKPGRTPPHGKIECFLKYQDNCLSVQVSLLLTEFD
jgi:hypothetical protein